MIGDLRVKSAGSTYPYSDEVSDGNLLNPVFPLDSKFSV